MDREFTAVAAGGEPGSNTSGVTTARRLRPKRPVTDYGSTMVRWMRHSGPKHTFTRLLEYERPSASFIVDLQLPLIRASKAIDSVPAKHLHSSLNKIRHPINVVLWTPEGRRLLTASSSGEITLWNGMGFNFETIWQAHHNSIRAAQFSHSNDWLISADQDGVVKYWQPNFNNIKEIQAHSDAIRGVAFSPSDSKFVTAADDSTLKIFDFAGGTNESILSGHQWELRCVDWHPTKALIVSGSRDHSVKLWDPRSARCLLTLNAHKNQVSKTLFEPRVGDLFATCGRDHAIRIFDLRMLRDVFLLRGHDKEINAIVWHPIHRNLLSAGSGDGAIIHYLLDEPNTPDDSVPTTSPYDTYIPQNCPAQTIYPVHIVPYAHEFAIWSLSWHPLGHILTSGSNDRVTRFWARPRPGDSQYLTDRYHIGQANADLQSNTLPDRKDFTRKLPGSGALPPPPPSLPLPPQPLSSGPIGSNTSFPSNFLPAALANLPIPPSVTDAFNTRHPPAHRHFTHHPDAHYDTEQS